MGRIRWQRIGRVISLVSSALLVVPLAAAAPAPALATGPAAAPANVVTVDETRSAGTLPADFIGLSYEAKALASSSFDPAQGNLLRLLRDLGRGNLRIGGNTVDRDVFWQPNGEPLPPWAIAALTPAAIGRLATLTRESGWNAELAVNLGHLDAAAIANESQLAASAIGPRLRALECGNEPDLYARNGLRTPTYGFAQYMADFETCAGAIAGAAVIAGPDTATGAFMTDFVAAEAAKLSTVTTHMYPLSNCNGPNGTVTDLLAPATDAKEVSRVASPLRAARAAGLPLRIDETNSASCGGIHGVSDTLGAALWAADMAMLLAGQGVVGVNLHGGIGLCAPVAGTAKPNFYTPLCAATPADAQAGVLTAQPLFYGLLLVHLLGSGELMPVQVDSAQNLTGYAVRGADGRTRVLLIDKDETGKSVNVSLRAGLTDGEAQVVRLTGKALASADGIAIQGARVERSGEFEAGRPDEIDGRDGTFRLKVRSGSATLVTLPAATTR
jgi:hypothetical protein